MLSSLLAPALPWAVEAFTGAGDLERSESAAAAVAAEAARVTHPRLALYASRCRGHVLAAQGELDAGLAELEGARALSGDVRCPLERARTLVLLGQALRRARRRTDAREVLGEARTEFERAGARLWVQRTGRELGRIGGRTATRDELTSGERRVAELVAEGMSNREAAAALFVTSKTVEAALSRVYRKLGSAPAPNSRATSAARPRRAVGPARSAAVPRRGLDRLHEYEVERRSAHVANRDPLPRAGLGARLSKPGEIPNVWSGRDVALNEEAPRR